MRVPKVRYGNSTYSTARTTTRPDGAKVTTTVTQGNRRAHTAIGSAYKTTTTRTRHTDGTVTTSRHTESGWGMLIGWLIAFAIVASFFLWPLLVLERKNGSEPWWAWVLEGLWLGLVVLAAVLFFRVRAKARARR